MAFDPNFTKNGHFYVNYLADQSSSNYHFSMVLSYRTIPNKADEKSEKILLDIPQLSDSHSGGQLAFGPDHYLYIALGDGSPYGDILGNAQNRSSLLGKSFA